MTNTNPERIKEITTRGIEDIIEKDSLLKKLKSGKRLRVKHGVDPTGPKIHIGRAIQLWKLKAFQDLGHQVVLIIGDFTAQIGDASDKDAARKQLTAKEVQENLKDYVNQIGKILNMKEVELRYNSEWLGKLTAKELLNLEMHFTTQQMIHRRNFKERWDGGMPIGVHELNYPILQGYDSVAVKADIEIGGFDQLFNLKVGRDIQRIFGQKPQDVITSKMLNGLDGRKMSTSWGNIITIIDEPKEMYGKIMSMKDEQIPEYFELCTRLSLEEVAAIKKQLKNKKTNPRDTKARLAREIVALYHSKSAAEKAEAEFNRVFREKELPKEMPKVSLADKKIGILDLLLKMRLATSKSDARRLIDQKAVRINGEIETDWKKVITPEKDMIIQAGKRRFVRIN